MWRHPLSWLVIGDGNSTSVYNDSEYLTSSLSEVEPYTAITYQPKETGLNVQYWNILDGWNY